MRKDSKQKYSIVYNLPDCKQIQTETPRLGIKSRFDYERT